MGNMCWLRRYALEDDGVSHLLRGEAGYLENTALYPTLFWGVALAANWAGDYCPADVWEAHIMVWSYRFVPEFHIRMARTLGDDEVSVAIALPCIQLTSLDCSEQMAAYNLRFDCDRVVEYDEISACVLTERQLGPLVSELVEGTVMSTFVGLPGDWDTSGLDGETIVGSLRKDGTVAAIRYWFGDATRSFDALIAWGLLRFAMVFIERLEIACVDSFWG